MVWCCVCASTCINHTKPGMSQGMPPAMQPPPAPAQPYAPPVQAPVQPMMPPQPTYGMPPAQQQPPPLGMQPGYQQQPPPMAQPAMPMQQPPPAVNTTEQQRGAWLVVWGNCCNPQRGRSPCTPRSVAAAGDAVDAAADRGAASAAEAAGAGAAAADGACVLGCAHCGHTFQPSAACARRRLVASFCSTRDHSCNSGTLIR